MYLNNIIIIIDKYTFLLIYYICELYFIVKPTVYKNLKTYNHDSTSMFYSSIIPIHNLQINFKF